MPLGNFDAFTSTTPFESRPLAQQSSTFTNTYPAAFKPLATIASAVCSTTASLIPHPNVFQSFQPMGGVRARLLVRANALSVGMKTARSARKQREGLINRVRQPAAKAQFMD